MQRTLSPRHSIDYVTIKDCVKRLKASGCDGITEYFIRRLVNEGYIPYLPVGNRKMICIDDLSAYIEGAKRKAQ